MKKVLPMGEHSSPEARAQRLRRARNIANLSREKMCEDGSINIYTYKGWEIARFGGLSYDGAERSIKQLAKAGVVCTLDWLLHGQGMEPYIIPNFHNIKQSTTVSPHENPTNIVALIHNELSVFKNQFADTIDYTVIDDGLSPHYNPGDWVAGVRRYNSDIKDLVGKNCIVEMADGRVLLRYLRAGSAPEKFTLCCSNVNTSTADLIIHDASLLSAAPVIRHYCLEK